MSMLIAKNLVKNYGTEPNVVRALSGLDLVVEVNEFVAIVGASGSGKSTLLNMLGGLDVPTSGQVIINGVDLSGMNEKQLTLFRRRNIGFVFQSYNLIPILNVYDNIVFSVEIDGRRIDDSFVRDIVDALGISDKLNNLPGTLSGGQQQRVAIARALASKPSIILADEPTGNLDSKNSDEVFRLLTLANSEFNQTVIIITHNESLAEQTERIVRIHDGMVFEG